MNELIYNPEKEYKEICSRIAQLGQTRDLYNNMHAQLNCIIVSLEKTLDQNVDLFLQTTNNLACSMQFLYDNWPWQRSRTKLFVIDFDKYIAKTKKSTTLKIDKIKRLLTDWRIEQAKLNIELQKRQAEFDEVNSQVERFTLPNGSWSIDTKSRLSEVQVNKVDHMNLTLNYFKHKTWYAWPNDLENLSGFKFKPKDVGIGAGENWLAYIFGATVQGQSSTFDLAIPGNDKVQKWEVKEYDEKTLTIRLGSSGTNSTEKMSLEICDILQQLKHFCEVFVELFPNENHSFIDPNLQWISRYVSSLETYLQDNFSKIVIRGELSNNDLQDLVSPIAGASKIHEMISCYDEPYMHLVIGSNTISIDYDKLLQLALLFSKHLSEKELLYALLATLKHPVLTGAMSYKTFLDRWGSYMTPRSAFGDIDGVFLVHKNGFLMIEHSELDDCFDYIRMSQGRRPNFKIKNMSQPVSPTKIGFFGYAYSDAIAGNIIPLMPTSSSLSHCYMTDDEIFQKTSPWQFTSINDSYWHKKQQTKIITAI